jgi:hypothetical protein
MSLDADLVARAMPTRVWPPYTCPRCRTVQASYQLTSDDRRLCGMCDAQLPAARKDKR